jgi:hypothetical protein
VTPTPENCPHCGISLDEPMNSSENAK